MGAIYKRELRSYLTNLNGIIFLFLVLIASGVLLFMNGFAIKETDGSFVLYPGIEYMILGLQEILMIAIPILTMRTFSEEKKNGTDKFLLSLPITSTQIVLGKYFSMFTLIAAPAVIFSFLPIVLSIFGEVYFPIAYMSILGYLLLGATLLAISMYVSSTTGNQVVSIIVSLLTLFALYICASVSGYIPAKPIASLIGFIVLGILAAIIVLIVTKKLLPTVIVAAATIIPTGVLYIFFEEKFGGLFNVVLYILSPFTKYQEFLFGYFNLASLIFYLCVICLFVFLTVQSFDKKRWD